MIARERVAKALAFAGPDRIPLAKGDDADIAHVGYRPARDFVPTNPLMDEWGCLWRSLNASAGDQGQVVEHPLADWSNIDHYRFPDPFASGRLDNTLAEIQSLHRQGKFVCASLGKGPMHLPPDLRGFEPYLADLMTEPERVERLLDGIFLFLSGMVQRFADLGADAVLLFDDQAIQTGPLFSMDIWRLRFKPRYRRLFSLAHDEGPVGSDLVIEVLAQPSLWMQSPGADTVRGKVAFSTCIDIQSVMGVIALDEIEQEVSRLVRTLSVPEGGFIGTCYHQDDLAFPPEKTDRMLQTFKAFRWA